VKLFRNVTCGSYQQSNYWANNFDDFFVSFLNLIKKNFF